MTATSIIFFLFSILISVNKTKVLSVQLGKTLGLNKVPITETEESTQARKKNLFDTFLTQREGGGVIIKEG